MARCFLALLGWLLTVFFISCATLWAGCTPAALVVAIDAGHGPRSPGATSASGVAEYRFNIRLAGKIVDALSAAGFPKAFLIDPAGLDLTPMARARRANAAGADLLISIHHDSAQAQFFTSHSDNGQPRRYSDHFAGYSVFYSGRNRQADDSLALARLIGRQMRREGLAFTRHHAADIPGERRPLVDDQAGVYRYDGLAVLHGAAMPAALLEAGVIVNRAEETALAGEERQMQTARAVARAVVNWCAGLRP
ncbi:N-acetylmuramoyl-L-alanine amidase family protein [Solidesulfovibrio sp.]